MIVKENIDFVRGINPKASMKVGLEKAIPLNFEKMKELDTKKLIDHIYVDGTYPYVYIYISAKFFAGSFDWEDEKKIDYGKKTLKPYFNKLILKSGMDQYIVWDSHENIDEIVYKVKPAYIKTFYKIYNDLNNT